MIGKLPRSSKGGHVYLLVAVNKFTKWIEDMPVTNQKGKTAVKFFESMVYRFVVPHSIITDNGSNFISKEFQDFCEGLGINITYASVAHPQTNGAGGKGQRPNRRWHQETPHEPTRATRRSLDERATL